MLYIEVFIQAITVYTYHVINNNIRTGRACWHVAVVTLAKPTKLKIQVQTKFNSAPSAPSTAANTYSRSAIYEGNVYAVAMCPAWRFRLKPINSVGANGYFFFGTAVAPG